MTIINIGGEDRPLHFGRNGLIEFEKLTGKGLLTGDSDFLNSIESIRALTYAGLKWGLYKPSVGTEPAVSFTLIQVGDWLDEAEDQADMLAKILKEFADSMPKPKKEEPKKETAPAAGQSQP